MNPKVPAVANGSMSSSSTTFTLAISASSTDFVIKFFLIPLVVALLTPLVSAQTVTLLASNLPDCAKSCTALTDADSTCTRPPVTDDDIYENCFCQSALLTSLYSAAAVQRLCPSCGATDVLIIQKWYQDVCSDGAFNFGSLSTFPAILSSTAQIPSVDTSTSTDFIKSSSTQTLPTVVCSGPSPNPTATSLGHQIIAKIVIGVGVPLSVIFFASGVLTAYLCGQRKQLTKSRRELSSSTTKDRGNGKFHGEGNDHGIGHVPENDGVEIRVHLTELEGSLGPKRHELP